MESDAAVAQRALEVVFSRLYGLLEGARFERRGDLFVALYPPSPIPQCNGPWVVEDTPEAAGALAEAIAEVEATGATPWVQTRSGHERTQRAAADLGLTQRETLPGMVLRRDDLVAPSTAEHAVRLVSTDEIAAATAVLSVSFGMPTEMLEPYLGACARLGEASWYVVRVGDEIAATSLGITIDGVTGVFNVATAPEHRGRGLGAAVTARAARDGFAQGATLAHLQSSAMGHGVYRSLGFRDVEEYVLLTRPTPA